MRIDRLEVQNFKKFKSQVFDLHPHFTLLVGENGSGKTTVLDALAVSLAVWLIEPPDATLGNSRRNIRSKEIRLEPFRAGDRGQFRDVLPTLVKATGKLLDQEPVTWVRQVRERGKRTTNADAKDALAIIREVYRRDAAGEPILCPVLAYYGAGRAWLASNQRLPAEAESNGTSRRWSAFYDCFGERIRFDELRTWFRRETTAAGIRGGRMRPGFEVVKRAVLGCVTEADNLWFDPDLDQIVLSIEGQAQPFDNLSAGHRMMLAVAADIAIKAVKQNAHLLSPDGLSHDEERVPLLLKQTPGAVLIDELDVHLHPRWQRRCATDLKRMFPEIQFVCTSHSPQVIGELRREEVRILDAERVMSPSVAFGADSN